MAEKPLDSDQVQSMPPGIVLPYAGASAPSGYLLCNGASKDTTTYAALFAILGYTYGGSGANFSLPDLRGRVPVGKSTDAEFDALGETGGEKTHTLSEAEMPSHNHSQGAPAGSGVYYAPTGVPGNLNESYPTGSRGSNTAHNNLQPYITLNYIIKY